MYSIDDEIQKISEKAKHEKNENECSRLFQIVDWLKELKDLRVENSELRRDLGTFL